MTTYTDIRARLEAATGPDRELNEEIAFAIRWRPTSGLPATSFAEHEAKHGYETAWTAHAPFRLSWPIPDYTASIDAAIALVEEKLPGWSWRLMNVSHGTPTGMPKCSLKHPISSGRDVPGFARTPALAILTALFAALEANDA